MIAKIKNIFKPKSEKLTNATVKRLIGHTNVVYYNFETNAWNTKRYNNYSINSRLQDTETMQTFRTIMTQEPEFSAQYEMVASVTMTTKPKYYHKSISRPTFSKTGTAVVGNIIVKNKTTGKYELYGKSWMDVDVYRNPGDAAKNGTDKFARMAIGNSYYRDLLLLTHTR